MQPLRIRGNIAAMSQTGSFSLAFETVEREIEEKTGVLILANLGLSSLPAELFTPALDHVTQLHLGNGSVDIHGEETSRVTSQNLGNNTFSQLPESIRNLRNLQTLKCQRVKELCERVPLDFPHLEVLDLSDTGIEDLKGLTAAPNLRILDLSRTPLVSLENFPDLPGLEMLFLTGAKIENLEGIQSCNRLEILLVLDTDVADLEPLSGHPHLQILNCDSTPIRSLVPLPELRTLRCSSTKIVSLQHLEHSPKLQDVACYGTKIADLTPLGALKNLEELTCFNTAISDLTPLDGMPLLKELDCARTKVKNLRGLHQLPALIKLCVDQSDFDSFEGTPVFPELRVFQCTRAKLKDFSGMPSFPGLNQLDLHGNQIRNLESLPELPELTNLNLGNNPLENISGIEKLESLRKLSVPRTRIEDLWPLSRLSDLREFDLENSLVSDLSPLRDLTNLEVLNLWGNSHIDLDSLSGLHRLKELTLWDTRVHDLSPLSGLRDLRKLSLGYTKVTDLSPLAHCRELREVNLSGTKISDLSTLTHLPLLEKLDCHSCEFSNSAPLALLINLKKLNVGFTHLDSLEFISGYTRLESFNCSDTEISDLEPLREMQDLMVIDFSDTPVKDIEPLVDLPKLMLINCSNTGVSDLRPFQRMQEIFSLTCEGCHFEHFSPEILEHMYKFDFSRGGGTIRGIPHEITQGNCIDDLIAHCKDLEQGAVANDEVKVLVLGNGLVGKTQICNHLRGLPFEQESDSTHGISVATAELAGDPGLRLNLWDFGGQDLYYGTHSLFARGRSIFLLVWSPDSELSENHVTHGIVHRNRELLWWLGYARMLGGPDAAVIVVQNKCEEKEQIWEVAPGDDGELGTFGFKRSIACSAKNGRGLDELTETIRAAANWIQDRDGPSDIGTGRAKVRQTLQEMRETDLTKPSSERSHRLITIEQFETICADTGGVSSPERLLRYLNSSGFLFYRKGLFGNKVVLDQSWALDAIYSIFQRETVYPTLLAAEGRFTRPFIGGLAWEGNGNTHSYSIEEQRVFIGMMIECGICYINKRSGKVEWNDLGNYEWVPDDEAIFVAPDLLPELDLEDKYMSDIWVWGCWGRAPEDQWSRSYWFPFLPPGYIQRILALFDRQYEGPTVLWNQGIAFSCAGNHSFDFSAGPYFSHIRIEQIPDAEGSSGRIQIRARDLMGGHPLKEICEKIDGMIDSSGISGVVVEEVGKYY